MRRRPDGSWETPQASSAHRGYAALRGMVAGRPFHRASAGMAVKVLDLNTETERSLTDAPSTANLDFLVTRQSFDLLHQRGSTDGIHHSE